MHIYMAEYKLGCIGLRWSTSDEMEHSVFAKALQGGSGNFRGIYGVESLSPTIKSFYFIRSNPAVHHFGRDLR